MFKFLLGFCVLGVLCDLYRLEKYPEVQWTVTRTGFSYVLFGHSNSLPQRVMKWADIKDCSGALYYNGEKNSLIKLNNEGVDFIELADIIEKKYEEL
jgi:hypothetical protein